MADVFTIDDLNALAALTAADEVPVWDSEEIGEPTKKITGSNLASSVKTLGSLLGTSDVVNNLTSTATDKPGSANMLKTLSDKINKIVNITSDVTVNQTYITVNQSAFGVAEDGKLIGSLDFEVDSTVPVKTELYSGFPTFPKQSFMNYWIVVCNVNTNSTYTVLLYASKIAPYYNPLPAGTYRGSFFII
jgi:hypothetical protein